MRVMTSVLTLAVWIVVLSPPPASSQAADFRLLEATIDGIHDALKARRITCAGLVQAYLARIEAYDRRGPRLTAVQSLNPAALQEARQLDERFDDGLVGPLHCIPTLVKDQVDTRGIRTTVGSAVFQEFVPDRDATVITKLKAAGAVILGKNTMGEFAGGVVGSAFGIIRNAYDPSRHASSSSGGTGAAIAANFATIGIGEDTGGSIRGPAAVASLVGLRPTTHLVSAHGVWPFRPSSDMLGPITRTVKDAAIVLDVIAGYDPADPATAYAIDRMPQSYTASLNADGLRNARIGVLREPMDRQTDHTSEDYRKVRIVLDKAIADLARLEAVTVEAVAIPGLHAHLEAVWDENTFETEEGVNRYLSHHPNSPVKTVRELVLSERIPPAKAQFFLNYIGRSTQDPGYLKVLLAREKLRQVVLTLMADHRLDALVYGTFDHQPSVIPPDAADFRQFPGLGNRALAAVLGFPALTVPAGFTTDGLPVGVEFLGRPFRDDLLLKFGAAYEHGTRHRRPPSTTPPLPGEPQHGSAARRD